MKKFSFFFLIFVLAATISANYAFFNSSGLMMKGQELSFTVYGKDLKAVTLIIREVKDDSALLSKLMGDEKEIGSYLGAIVVRRTYTPTKDWETFSLKLDRLGLYHASLTSRDEQGREVLLDETFLVVTDMGAIYFTDDERTILCVLRQDGGFVSGAKVLFYRDSKLVFETQTDSRGLAICEVSCDFFYVKKGTCTFGEIYFPYKEEYADEKLFLITDRPVYKPNDSVRFRGQLFNKHGNFYRALGNSSVSVIVKDPKDNEIYKKFLVTDELGGFFDEFKLPQTASVGIYDITILHADKSYYNSFIVEEYRKPEYKISIQTPEEPLFSGKTLRLEISVRYFNEQPVARAQVAYYVHAKPIYEEPFLAYRGLDFTDEEGKLIVEIKTEEGFDGYYTIEAIATDESQRQVEETESVRVWPDDVKIELEQDEIWTSPGESLKISVSVMRVSGEPIDGELKIKVDATQQSAKVVNGKAEFTFSPSQSKTYQIELAFGKAKRKLQIHAYGKGYKPSELTLLCSERTVQPGQMVLLNVISAHRATGLLTLIAEKIYEVIPIDLIGTASITLQVPENVVERNLFIVFLGFENGRQVEKNQTISVKRQINFSKLKISFDKLQYEPGEMATLSIEGEADNACLALIDEAIYAMLKQAPPNLEEFLYPENLYPSVSYGFAHTWKLYSLRDTIYARLVSKETSFENFKKNAVMEKINVREYFPDTALWIPSLRLERGYAVLQFKVPDSITTFRATVYGFSPQLFSQGFGSMIVSKSFYVRPHLPSFFRENDLLQIGATVFNQTNEPLETRYWLEIPKTLRLIEPEASKEVHIPPNSSITQKWFVRTVQPSDPSTITFYAVSKLTDAVALNVPIKPFAFEREYYFLEKVNGIKNFRLPEGEYIQAKLKVLTSIVPIVKESIEKLIHYPYGCTEQTMSSFFPAVIATRLGLDFPELEEIVQKGLVRLYNYQHSDGGWGWWEKDESHQLMSAYVMEGLYHAVRAGYEVSRATLERGIDYLKSNLTGYGAYVLHLYGVKCEFEPKDDIDFVFDALVSRNSLQKAINLLKQTDRMAYLQLDYQDQFISDVQLCGILLRAILKWEKDSPIVGKLINYLMSKKDGYFWYSTKDTSYSILALLEALPQFDRPNISVKNNDKSFYFDTEAEISLDKGSLEIEGEGLVEVHVVYLDRPAFAVSEGLKINRRIYKRYELYLEEDKQLIDAFIPLDAHLAPVRIKRMEPEKTVLYVSAFEYEEPRKFEYGGVRFSIRSNQLELFNSNYNFEKLIASSDFIVAKLENNTALVCDVKSKIIMIYQDVKDVTVVGSNIAFLRGKGLWLNNVFLASLPEEAEELICSNKEILLKSKDSSYWFKEGSFVELPFVARIVHQWDGKRLVADGVKFSGNDSYIGDGTFEIMFADETVKLEAGSIAKTVLKLDKNGGQYLVVEDFFASCAQVITNYREKNFGSAYLKFDYGWYRPWDVWYSARELHEDRIAFFATFCSGDTFSYVWRATGNGIYHLLPARAFSMYKQGLYAHSDPCVLHIGMDSEDLEHR
ncbi:MG2 domain-containing protein [Pseudothermotoga sp.]|nr:MG2 domain-containing protein [Pseudothermotoga sp.]MDW8139034.1 alpha-2-macroglobulin family protein [Pseudothermotoga sp.]